MAKVREIAWPDEYSDLKRIEEFMVCGICYEYMDTSVMTPCSHNYCSLCIRKYLHYKAQCPACFHVFFEKDLYINRSMDGLIQHYLQLREKLVTLIQNRAVYNTVVQQADELPSTPPVRPVRSSQLPKSPKTVQTILNEPKTPTINSPLASTSRCNEPKTPTVNSPFPNRSRCNASSPSTTKSPKVIPSIAKIFDTPKRKETIVPLLVVDVKTVACPVCSVDISEHHINVHLDACLKRETTEETMKEKLRTSKRPPLPKLVLRVMKDAELRKKMKEFGLSTQGDRRTLENRFTRYSTIYNAECDKLDPRPIPELIRQCEMDEKQERKMDSFLVAASTTNRLQIERNAKEEKIEEAQKKYREVNKSSFDKLIEEVRNRRKMEKAKESSDETISSSSKPSTSADTENASGNVSDIDENGVADSLAQVSCQYSDSDESSCPLQHYRGDDVNQDDTSSCASPFNSPIKRPQEVFKNIDQAKELVAAEKIPKDPYEVTTDDSTDDDIPSSPVLNLNPHRKRVRLAKKLINKSTSSVSSSSTLTNHSVEKDDREAVARELCNSIIQDFSFDGLTDDSSNEFANKPNKSETETNENKELSKTNVTNISQESKLEKEINSSNESKIPDERVNNTVAVPAINNGFGDPIDDFSFDILNNDSSNEFVNIGFANSKETAEQSFQQTAKESFHLNDTKMEKENNSLSINNNAEISLNDDVVRRPVRKRNRPSRFLENQVTNGENKVKESSHLDKESHESDVLDGSKSAAPSDGSFKRRRGRSKVKSTDQSSDEVQNPPKRPVRRRQAASGPNLY